MSESGHYMWLSEESISHNLYLLSQETESSLVAKNTNTWKHSIQLRRFLFTKF